MIDMKVPDKEMIQMLTKILEQEYGYADAHKLIDKAVMEYAIMKTNQVLEKR